MEFGISIEDGSSRLSSFASDSNNKSISLRDWQRRGLDYFFGEANGKALFESCTGSGKSLFAVEIIKKIWETNPKYKVLIVVPKNVIMETGWYKELYDAGISIKDIGIYYGNIKEYGKITITNMQNLDRIATDMFDVLVLDECFTGDTKISLMPEKYCEDNKKGHITESTIKYLVEHKSKKKIITFNTETKEFELKKIIDWIKIPIKRETITLTFNNGTSIKCTPEQEFYNGEEYIKACDINIGDNTIYFGKDNNLIHNNYIKQLMINSIVGDGCVGTNNKRGRLLFSCIHKSYMEFKKSFFEEFGNDRFVSKGINNGYKKGIIYSYRTNLCKDVREFYLKYKKEGIKFLLSQLDDFGLALWLYDDGSFNRKGNGGDLHTQGFSYEDNVKICEWFWSKGFDCRVGLSKTKVEGNLYQISMRKKGALMCNKIMKKYPIECFEYKFNHFNEKIDKFFEYKKEPVVDMKSLNNIFLNYKRSDKRPCFVKCTGKKTNLEKEYVYDLKVEDNHNFIANGMLVHNCHNYMTKRLIPYVKQKYKYKLGLSATIERSDNRHWDLMKIFDYNVFKYTAKEALTEGVLNAFNFTNIGVEIDPETYKTYEGITIELNALLKAGGGFNKIMRGSTGLKYKMLALMGKRKDLINNYIRKFEVVKLVIEKNKGKKTIVFNEYNSTTNKSKWFLLDLGIKSVIIHSGIPNDKREEGLRAFKEGKVNIILTSKVLDEGWNVPAVEVGIIAAGNSTSRQTVQRMGRILRKKDKDSELYQIYCKDTVEEDYANKRAELFKELSSNYTDQYYNLKGELV